MKINEIYRKLKPGAVTELFNPRYLVTLIEIDNEYQTKVVDRKPPGDGKMPPEVTTMSGLGYILTGDPEHPEVSNHFATAYRLKGALRKGEKLKKKARETHTHTLKNSRSALKTTGSYHFGTRGRKG